MNLAYSLSQLRLGLGTTGYSDVHLIQIIDIQLGSGQRELMDHLISKDGGTEEVKGKAILG